MAAGNQTISDDRENSMAKNKTNTSKKIAGNNKQKKSNLPLFLAAAVILCLAVIVTVIPKGGKQDDAAADANIAASDTSGLDETAPSTGNVDASISSDEEAQVVDAGSSLVIPISEVSSAAQFYPVEVDGTRMEVLAVQDSDGNIRTAFNTCQVCYGSGRGYYVQQGNVLVCQNCGNRFTVDQVEVESGGCNPWPIFAEDKTVTDDSIEISYDFLRQSKEIFANWKISY